MYYSTDVLVCISIAPRNNVCGPMNFPWISEIPAVNFPWNWAYWADQCHNLVKVVSSDVDRRKYCQLSLTKPTKTLHRSTCRDEVSWVLSLGYSFRRKCPHFWRYTNFLKKPGSPRPQTPAWYFHLWSYFKHTSFSCRYIRRDIKCKHDVMNIQHAHCGLVGSDRGTRKVGPWVHWPATGIHTRRL